MVGLLFEKLAGPQLPAGIGAVVRSAFDGLAEAQKDLLSGGLQLAPLAYDQAQSLTELVARVSDRRVVLILDAWEKSPSVRHEVGTLEAFLKHLDDWPDVHLLLAVRDPELEAAKPSDEALQQAKSLDRLSPAAQIYRMQAMDLDEPAEQTRLLEHLRSALPATREQSAETLLGWLDGYPGVLNFWTTEAQRLAITGADQLRNQAEDAHELRYSELAPLLAALDDAPLATAARLAFLPRLDAELWEALREPSLAGALDQTAIDLLTDRRLLIDERHPSFGHDTRHAAVRRWFIESRLPLMRRHAERLIESIACSITGFDSRSRPYCEALVGCAAIAEAIGTDRTVRCAIDAAHSGFRVHEPSLDPAFDQSFPKLLARSPRAAPLIANALNNRGAVKHERGDVAGALADYGAVIDLAGTPIALLAKALYNRGVARNERGDIEAAMADHGELIGLVGAPVDLVARALVFRGVAHGKRNELVAAMADFEAAIGLAGAEADVVAAARYHLGFAKDKRGDIGGAIAEFDAVIALVGAPVDLLARALIDRGNARYSREDLDGAMADFDAIVALAGASPSQVALALNNRAIAKFQHGDDDGGLADCEAVILLAEAPPDEVAKALYNCGWEKGRRRDFAGAMSAFDALIGLDGAPPSLLVKAHYNRGATRQTVGDPAGAAADFAAILALPGSAADVVELARQALAELQAHPRDAA
ncbi:tetratricopeptide repeat protein [Rivibacter subsaxonicus]|nr:hypothetical protein [Rivibacter subsaxonicus]